MDAWVEERLRQFADGGPDALAVFKRELKGKVLESYRNGQKACPVCRPRTGTKRAAK